MSHPHTLERRSLGFDPSGAGKGFWLYRRIADAGNFVPGTYRGGTGLVNWPQNDYLLGNLVGVSPEEAEKQIARAKQLSLSLLYWPQTEAPPARRGNRLEGPAASARHRRHDRRPGQISLHPRVEDYPGGVHGPGETCRPPRPGAGRLGREEVTAEVFLDSVGVGSYRIDLHPSSGGDNYIDVSSLLFQIPLRGPLFPRRVENLLAACKNPRSPTSPTAAIGRTRSSGALPRRRDLLAAFRLENKL